MKLDIESLPENPRKFIQAVWENARKVEEWDDDDWVKGLLYVKTLEDGSVQVSDNFERFFDTIYTFRPDGTVGLRWGYSDRAPQEYDMERALSDASIMYTG